MEMDSRKHLAFWAEEWQNEGNREREENRQAYRKEQGNELGSSQQHPQNQHSGVLAGDSSSCPYDSFVTKKRGK